MSKLLFLALILVSVGVSFQGMAVATECGVFRLIEGATTRNPLIERTHVYSDGEIIKASSQFIAVNEEATDTMATLSDGESVCFKANSYLGDNRQFYVFKVWKK